MTFCRHFTCAGRMKRYFSVKIDVNLPNRYSFQRWCIVQTHFFQCIAHISPCSPHPFLFAFLFITLSWCINRSASVCWWTYIHIYRTLNLSTPDCQSDACRKVACNEYNSERCYKWFWNRIIIMITHIFVRGFNSAERSCWCWCCGCGGCWTFNGNNDFVYFVHVE